MIGKEWIGSGRIKVMLKGMECEDDGYVNLRCDGIETYGDRMCFSDADGDLIRHKGEHVAARIDQILRIKHE